ncbi:fructose PTS transporter subunit IIB [Bacillus sp. FSL H8-0547]
MKKIVGICACPMGVAHTYMAADSIEDAAKKLGCKVKVETQGAGGIEDKLSPSDIEEADLIVIASAVKLAGSERWEDHKEKVMIIDLKSAIKNGYELIEKRLAQ